MESSKQRKENEEAEHLARRNERKRRQRLSRRLPKKIEEILIRGKYRAAPTIDYGVKHKASLLIMRIYTCVLMLYKSWRSRTHPVYSLFKFQSKFMFCKCKTVFLLLM